MIAEILDIQDNCKGIHLDGDFIVEPNKEDLLRFQEVWKYSPILEQDQEYIFLFLFTQGQDLETFSKDSESYKKIKNTIESHKKAAITAKLDLTNSCFFDVIPRHQLKNWFHHRAEALGQLSGRNSQEDYEILHKIHVLTEQISRQNVSYSGRNGKIIYNMFGSQTGRLTTKKGSIPVLTLKKEQRSLLKPQNDVFVELDLNAAEIRMLMALSGKEQPEMDIHEWVSREVFSDEHTRDEIKIKVFSWLYNFSAPKSHLDEIFSRQIFRDFYDPETQQLTTPFGRKLIVEERKAQNYLLQSSTSDQVLENAYKIQKMLHGKKSQISFTLHDSIILDMDKKDAIMLKKIKDQFETTRWGRFVSTCKIGRTFGSLRSLDV